MRHPFPDGHDEGIPADPEAEQYHFEYHPSEARLAAAASFGDEPIEEELPW